MKKISRLARHLAAIALVLLGTGAASGMPPVQLNDFEDIDPLINSEIVKKGVANQLNEASRKAQSKIESSVSNALKSSNNVMSNFSFDLNVDIKGPDISNKKRGKSSGTADSASGIKSTPKKSSAGSSSDSPGTDIKHTVSLRQMLIDYSMTLRGIPYRLGGESPSTGLDCSGFVRYTAKNGINYQLPRTAKEMYSATRKIADAEREPGDLVFFRAHGKIDHVGIYLGKYEGSGRLNGRELFINSASEGPRTGVVISAIDEPYWKRHYSCSGRFLPSFNESVKNQTSR